MTEDREMLTNPDLVEARKDLKTKRGENPLIAQKMMTYDPSKSRIVQCCSHHRQGEPNKSSLDQVNKTICLCKNRVSQNFDHAKSSSSTYNLKTTTELVL